MRTYPISRFILILSPYLGLGLPSFLCSSGFPTKTLYATFLSTVQATCAAHLILLNSIPRIIFYEEYRSKSSSLCSLLHSPVSSSLLGSNVFLRTLFTNPLSLCPPPPARETRFHIQTKQQVKLHFCTDCVFRLGRQILEVMEYFWNNRYR